MEAFVTVAHSFLPFVVAPTTARKARDRNEVSERKIKFARSRLRRTKQKLAGVFRNECRSFCFVSLDHVVTHAWSARSPPAPSPSLKAGPCLFLFCWGFEMTTRPMSAAAYPTSSYQLSRGENRFQSGVIGFRRSGAGGYVLGPTGIAFFVMNGQLELG